MRVGIGYVNEQPAFSAGKNVVEKAVVILI